MTIDPLDDAAEAEACARLMAGTDPWITLGRGYEQCLRGIADPTREVHVARAGDRILGFLVLALQGPFTGYIQSIVVAPDARRQGIGAQLIACAEERIFKVSPNVFLCVSDFNTSAQRVYERLGYRQVGLLEDYIVRGSSEILLRKSRGPFSEFQPSAD